MSARIANGKEKRPYGKSPLELSLSEALDVLHRIAQAGRTLPESKLAAVLGNTVTSSAFTRKTRALAVYGLIVQQGEQYILTELGLGIAYPKSSESEANGIKEAFLRVEQFEFLFNQHKGKLLPAEEFLRNILEQECRIPRESSGMWVEQFRDGIRRAKLLFERSDGKVQISESPVIETGIAASATQTSDREPAQIDEQEAPPRADRLITTASQDRSVAQAAAGHRTRIELANGRYAEISIPDAITGKDAQKLQRALDGIKVIIDSMVIEET